MWYTQKIKGKNSIIVPLKRLIPVNHFKTHPYGFPIYPDLPFLGLLETFLCRPCCMDTDVMTGIFWPLRHSLLIHILLYISNRPQVTINGL